MALAFLDNVDYRGRKPNFERDQFDTLADMVAFSENYLPETFISTCVETGKAYLFNKSNSVDPVLGKWRPLNGALQKEIIASYAVGGIKEGDVLEPGKSLEDVLYNILVGKKEIVRPSYYGVAAEKTTDLTLLTKTEEVSNFTITINAHNEYIVIACPIEVTNVKIFNDGFDYTSSFTSLEQGTYRFFYSETKITCSNFDYTITYN